MNKGLEIAGYLLEIIMAMGCIYLSIGIWNTTSQTNEASKIAKSYENYGVQVNNETENNALSLNN